MQKVFSYFFTCGKENACDLCWNKSSLGVQIVEKQIGYLAKIGVLVM